MRKQAAATSGFLFGLSALAAWSHFATAGIEDPPVCGNFAAEVDSVPATASMGGGFIFATGFETIEAYTPGYISNSGGTPVGCGGGANPCWGHTTAANASLITPTIESIHPASGLQHLRLTHDPTTRTNTPNFGLGVDARWPRTADLVVRPVAPTTVSVDLAISGPGGQNFRLQPQSNSQGCIQGSALFYEEGDIYILDDLCGTVGLNFQPTGFQWDTTGGHQNFTWVMNPCTNSINYFYSGNLIYSGCIILGTNLEQFLVFGDNYPGSHMDVDNVFMSSLDECPHTCGDGVITAPFEECELTAAEDAACPGRCIAAGEPGECTCSPICTFQNPCPVQNGENGPFISSSGFYVYSGDLHSSPSMAAVPISMPGFGSE